MSSRIEHSGVVECVGEGRVTVRFVAGGACASCRAREACGMGESSEKTVEVMPPQAAHYRPGEAVTVSVSRRAGLAAVAVAYVGAFLVLIGAVGLSLALGRSEGFSALAGLVGLGAYYVVLWLLRGRIAREIHFTITKQ